MLWPSPASLRWRHLHRDPNEMDPEYCRGDFTSKGSERTRRQDIEERKRRPVYMKQERHRK